MLFQNTLGSSQSKRNKLMSKGRSFDKVEPKMSHIQSSLSSSSLTKPESNKAQVFHNTRDDKMVTRLKRELEEKELLKNKFNIDIILYTVHLFISSQVTRSTDWHEIKTFGFCY